MSGAEHAYRRALELRPHYASAQQWLGCLYCIQGHFE